MPTTVRRTVRLTAATAACAAAVAVMGPAPATAASDDGERTLGRTKVAVSPGVASFLEKAGVTPTTIGPAKAAPFRGTLAVDFPISKFVLSSRAINHVGGLRLTGGGRTIALRAFVINLAAGRVSAKVSGSIGNAGRVPVFTLANTTAPRLGLLSLKLTPTAADALNGTFKIKNFKAGATFGFATPQFRV